MNCQLFQAAMRSFASLTSSDLQYMETSDNVRLILFIIDQGYKLKKLPDYRGLLIDSSNLDRDDIYVPADITNELLQCKYWSEDKLYGERTLKVEAR